MWPMKSGNSKMACLERWSRPIVIQSIDVGNRYVCEIDGGYVVEAGDAYP
jgi:hypothetical protein